MFGLLAANHARIRFNSLPYSRSPKFRSQSENLSQGLLPFEAEDKNLTKPSIRQVTGATFVSVLLGLVLKKLLDAFLPDGSLHNGISDIASAVVARGLYSVVVTAQLIIFLFALVRFYLGSFRYHEEELETTSGAWELLIDVIGAVGVFVSFYLASILIKTTNLFYAAFALITLIDLLWCWTAKKYSGLTKGMERVADLYVWFDVFALIPLVGFFVVEEYFGPRPYYLAQWVVLIVLFIIGCVDLKLLWPFYSDVSGWQERLTKPHWRKRR